MINPTAKTWAEWGINEECHKFLVIRWEEIFSFRTYNAWQLRSTNFVKLIIESIEVAKVVEFVPESHINIKRLIDEAKITTDYVIEEYYPFVKDYLDKLEKIYTSDIGSNIAKTTRKYIKTANVLLENLGEYEIKHIEYIKKILLETNPSNYKIKLNSLLSSLALLIADKDYSIKSLQKSVNILLDKSTPNFVDRFDNLVKRMNGNCFEFECSFFINWAGSDQNIFHGDIELTSDRPVIFNSDMEKEFFTQYDSSMLAKIRVNATEEYSAYIKAKQKIEELFGINQLYQPKKETRIRQHKALLKSGESEYLIDDDPYSNYAPPSSLDSSKSINEFLKIFNNILDKRDRDQLNACLQYHKLALRSDSEELRLVNLWISLESLFLGGDESIIKRICGYVPIMDTTGYIYSLLLAVSKSTTKLWKTSNTDEILKQLNKSNKHLLNAYDLLKILLSEEKSDLLTSFITIINNNPLLIHRIERLWMNVFGTPARLAKRLEEHKERVEWQIQRIYRARNVIMHTGASPKGTNLLIQHLHNYLVTTIHSIITDLKRNKNWGLQEAIEHRSMLYEYFIYRLKNYQSAKLSIDQIFYWDKVLLVTDQPAWSEQRLLEANN